MSEGFVGYQPELVRALERRVRVVVDDLVGVRSSDPAAAEAVSVVAVVRSHLETSWLPLLGRIAASTAMTASGGGGGSRPMAWRWSGDGEGPPSSEDFARDLIDAADDPAVGRRSDEVVLSNGWSWACGPVSATTGLPASGCEFVPPSVWDLSPALLVASVLPITGELIDGYDCVVGAIPCEAVLLPFFSGRAGRAVDDLLEAAEAAQFAVRADRSIDDILRPGGELIGRQGTGRLVREVTGTVADAEAMFIELSRGGELVIGDVDHILVRLPDGGYVGLRTKMSELSEGTNASIDVNIEGYEMMKNVKFNP